MRTITIGLLPLLVGAPPVWAQAHEESALYQLNIERQPLESALRQFALQTRLQIAHLADVDGKLATQTAVVGAFTAKEALRLLLAGTSLHYEFVNDHTVVILNPDSGNIRV
jgi:type II secretory pathway component HofQ